MLKKDNLLATDRRSIIKLADYRADHDSVSSESAPAPVATAKGNAVMTAMAVFLCTLVTCILYGTIN